MFFSVNFTTKHSYNTIIGHNNARNVYSTIPIHTHAEIDCVKQIKYNYIKTKKIKTYNLLLLRITHSNKLCTVRPCYHCVKQLSNTKFIKIKNIYYTDDDGNFIVDKFQNIINNNNKKNMSMGYKYRINCSKIKNKLLLNTILLNNSYKIS